MYIFADDFTIYAAANTMPEPGEKLSADATHMQRIHLNDSDLNVCINEKIIKKILCEQLFRVHIRNTLFSSIHVNSKIRKVYATV